MANKTIMIHASSIGGHQLEYIHHLYIGAIKRSSDLFVFVLPKRFNEDSKMFIWPDATNIKFVIMGNSEEPARNCSVLRKGWINSKTVGKYAREYKATDVIVISIIEYLPFLPLFLNKDIRFSGIIYRIYLYDWHDELLLMKMQDVLKYWIMTRCNVFHRVYMCNDSASAQCLNRIYKTNKFTMIPDPVASSLSYKGKDLREDLGIAPSKRILLHPGGMSEYKNTIGILKAISMLDEDSCNSIAVIFAGQIVKSIRKEFDALYAANKNRVQMFLFEGFLPFEKLADLFTTCDYVLVPYNVKSQSSGIVGHAAFYGKPVVAMNGGVIGKMVKKWHLGELLYRSSEVSLYQFLCSLKNAKIYDTNGNTYLESHTMEMFNKALLDD